MLEITTQNKFTNIFWDEKLFCKALHMNYEAFEIEKLFTKALGSHMPTYQEIYDEKMYNKINIIDQYGKSYDSKEKFEGSLEKFPADPELIQYINDNNLPVQFLYNRLVSYHLYPHLIRFNNKELSLTTRDEFLELMDSQYPKRSIYEDIYDKSKSNAEAYNAIKFINSHEFKFRDKTHLNMMHVFFRYEDIMDELNLSKDQFIRYAIKYPNMQILYDHVFEDRK